MILSQPRDAVKLIVSYARKPFVLAILGFILGFAFFRIHYGHSLHWILDQWAGLRAAVELVVLELRHHFTCWHVAPRYSITSQNPSLWASTASSHQSLRSQFFLM